MTERRRRQFWRRTAAVIAACVCALPALAATATGANLTQLHHKLGSAQGRLSGNAKQQQSIAIRIKALAGQVQSLAGQVQLVQSRESGANAQLTTYEADLTGVRAAIGHERRHLRHLHRVLGLARRALSAELLSQYEQPPQSLIDVILNASGFQQLLDSLHFLSMARRQEQTIITVTRIARARATAATARLTALERIDIIAASRAQTQTAALAGMSALLRSRQTALSDAQAAQATALGAAKARGAQLQAAIATIKKQVSSARQAERAIAYRPPPPPSPPPSPPPGTNVTNSTNKTSGATGTSGSGGSGLGSSGSGVSASGGSGGSGGSGSYPYNGWAIPEAIVLCESGGQNLPPNSAGASGYYQIMPATWRGEGGTGPAAYLASMAEQSAVAARLWNNGAGASNWTCAAMVGIS